MAHRTTSAGNKRQVVFFKVGGTWDMVKKNDRLIGSGGLDDIALAELEQKYAKQNLAEAEQKLCLQVEASISEAMKQPSDITEHLPWVPHIKTYVEGTFYSLFSGDGSHLRSSLIAPLVNFLLTYMNTHPDIQILGAQGTDTADLAILPLLDAFLFDTELLPVLFTGANRSRHEWNSDAPKNFSDLFQLAGVHLPAGSYWIFGSHLYRASDMLKIDPTESRRIENFTTFFAPRLTSRHTKKMIGENSLFNIEKGASVMEDHPIKSLTTQKLFNAMNEIEVIDLGSLNPVHEDVAKILDPKKKAVIIAAHALGNANNPIKNAVIEASRNGKIVLVIDKSLLGVVNGRYAAGLIWVNNNSLADGKYLVLSGHKMNKATARAILTRALVENFNQHETQQLINSYCESRQLLD
jgi:L-asparaginase/Glu-tRNA(Gln) amidotransferase subunit D